MTDTLTHTVHRYLLNPPTINVKVERNSRGFNWEATVVGAQSVDEALALLDTLYTRLGEAYGGAPV